MSKSKNNSIQKILALCLLLLISAFFIKEYKTVLSRKKFISGSHSEFLLQDSPLNQEKSFVILISSSDSFPFTEKNLISIAKQRYPIFKVVFIDTTFYSSSSLDIVKQLAHDLGIENKIAFYKAESFNSIYYEILKQLGDDEIIIHLEASDWLADAHVLNKLNEIYKDPDVWLTYSEYVQNQDTYLNDQSSFFKASKKTFSHIQAPWLLSPFKTYYVGLAKQANLDKVFQKKTPKNTDEIILKTLMQLSKWHIRFIPEVLYIHSAQPKALEYKQFSPPKKIGY